jgi:hypothetical protein
MLPRVQMRVKSFALSSPLSRKRLAWVDAGVLQRAGDY